MSIEKGRTRNETHPVQFRRFAFFCRGALQLCAAQSLRPNQADRYLQAFGEVTHRGMIEGNRSMKQDTCLQGGGVPIPTADDRQHFSSCYNDDSSSNRGGWNYS